MPDSTADICDELNDAAQVCHPLFNSYGKKTCFEGEIYTVKCLEDNSMVRKVLEEPGNGRVLVVDGNASMRCALLGDMLATLGIENNWSGVIVSGCIRDSEVISRLEIGVMALATHPRKSVKRGQGEIGISVDIAGVEFNPGHYVYADLDGVIVVKTKINQQVKII